jgi:hypothetical protein
VEIATVSEEITAYMLQDTADDLCFVYSESTRQKDLVLNLCSHKYHMHTNCPLQQAFVHIPYIEIVDSFTEYSVY